MAELKDIDAVAKRLEAARDYLHIEDKTAQLEALDAQVAEPGFGTILKRRRRFHARRAIFAQP